jgi:TRAP-type C4-dicarboxylate transport system permease small subunit
MVSPEEVGAPHVQAERTIGWRYLRGLYTVEGLLAGAVFVLLVAVTLLGVVMRYVLHSPLPWMIEIQLAGMVWIAFLGSAVAFRYGAHVAIEIIVDRLPRKARVIGEIVIAVIVYILLAYLVYSSVAYLENFVKSGRSTPLLEIPYYIVYGVAPLSCVLMAISYTTFNVVPTLRGLLGREQTESSATEGGVR